MVSNRLLLVMAFVTPSALACAGEYDITAFPGDKPAPSASASALDCPIETLAADPGAKAVIDKDIPGLLADRRYPMFKSMSLRTVAAMSSGRISKATLSTIDQELEAAPPAVLSRDERRPFHASAK